MRFGRIRQPHSQDADPNITCFGWRPILHGKTERFLSVLVPHAQGENPRALAAAIETRVTEAGDYTARVNGTNISIKADGAWTVLSEEKK